MPETMLKALANEAGDERVVIVRRADGLWTWRTQRAGEDGWDAGLDLGLYDSAEMAENEARARVPWLTSLFH